MSEALGAIGNVFGKLVAPANIGTTLSGATLGLGELGNLLAGRQQQQQASSLTAQQKAIQNMSPADFTRNVQAGEAPINQGLVQAVNNNVQGDLAARGLSQAPGTFAASEAQALAPFEQQNYQVALEQYLQKLGLPLSYAQQIRQVLPQQQNLTPVMSLLLQQLSKRSAPTTPPTFPVSPAATSTPNFNDMPSPGFLDLPSLGVGS